MSTKNALLIGEKYPLTEAIKKRLESKNQFLMHQWENPHQPMTAAMPENTEWAILYFKDYDEGKELLRLVKQQFSKLNIIGVSNYMDTEFEPLLIKQGIDMVVLPTEINSIPKFINLYPFFSKSPLGRIYEMIRNDNVVFNIQKKRPLSEITQKLSKRPKLKKIVEQLFHNRTFTANNLSTYLGCSLSTIHNQMPEIYKLLGVKDKAELLQLLDGCVWG